MSVLLVFNNKRFHGKGLRVTAETTSEGYSLFEFAETAETVDAVGKITLNGEVIPDALSVIEPDRNTISLEAFNMSETLLDLNKVFVEINIYGDIDKAKIERSKYWSR